MDSRGFNRGVQQAKNELLSLFAVFTAGRGIKDFFTEIVSGDAALGRMATRLGTTVEALDTYGNAVEKMGGSAHEAIGSFQGLTQNLEQMALTGQSSVIPYFRALNVQVADAATGKMRDIPALYDDLNAAVQGMSKPQANALLKGIGLDQGTIDMLTQAPAEFRRLLEEQKALGLANEKNAKIDQALEKSLKDVRQAVKGFARTIVDELSPYILDVIRNMDEWMQANGKWLRGEISRHVKDFVEWLKKIPWRDIKEGLKQFVAGVNAGAEALGGWTRIGEAFFALWAAGKVARLIAAIGSIRAALGVGIATGGLGSILLRGLPLAPLLALGAGSGDDQLSPDVQQKNKDNRAKGVANDPKFSDWWEKNGPSWLGGGRGVRGEQSQDTSGYKPILDLIGKAEGTDKGRGYNETLAYGKFTGGDQNLVGMTMKEIDDLQTKMLAHPDNQTLKSSALGRYQIVRTTLRSLRQKMGIGDDAKFDQSMQDRLAVQLIKGRTVEGDRHATRVGLFNEWSSYAHPDTGRGKQGTGATSAEIEAALNESQRLRAGSASRSPQPSEYEGALQKIRAAAAAARITVPPANTLPPSGAAASAAQRTSQVTGIHNDNSQQAELNGPITINTLATDAKGIAQDLGSSVRRYSFAARANTGLA